MLQFLLQISAKFWEIINWIQVVLQIIGFVYVLSFLSVHSDQLIVLWYALLDLWSWVETLLDFLEGQSSL